MTREELNKFLNKKVRISFKWNALGRTEIGILEPDPTTYIDRFCLVELGTEDKHLIEVFDEEDVKEISLLPETTEK